MDNVQKLISLSVCALLAAPAAHAQAGAWGQALLEHQQQQVEASRRQSEEARQQVEASRRQAEEARQQVQQQRERASADRDYQRGLKALDDRQWENAVGSFGAVPRDSGRGDAALYWKAYALNKLGRRSDAQAALADLEKSFPDSRWINDAKALELEVRQASGQPVRPESEADDDLKLMAINSLMNSDPERAIPLLEKVLQGTNPPKVKERALFVLVQSGSPRAREALVAIAHGKSNPDLQLKALEYLGLFGGRASGQALADIYASTTDPNVKRRILQSFMVSGDRDRLLAAARQEKNAELRRGAIRQLGLLRAVPQLSELSKTDQSPETRKAIIEALFLAGAAREIGEMARSEKDPQIRLDAIHRLGLMGNRTAGDLSAIYAADQDKKVRRAVIQALFLQSNATALIEIARKETDPELKTEAVHRLSLMRSKEATDFMMEILNK